MKWLMNRIATPCACSRRTISNSRSTSRPDIAEVGSSMTSTRASMRQRLDDLDRLPLGDAEHLHRQCGRRCPRAAAPADLRAAPRIAAQSMRPSAPRLAADEHVLGDREIGKEGRMLVNDGDALALRVERRRGSSISWPVLRIWPASGWWMPPRILTSVLLPAPFSPASACTRPACRREIDSLRTSTGPKRFVMPRSSTSGHHAGPPRHRHRSRSGADSARSGTSGARHAPPRSLPRRALVVVLLVVRLGELQRLAGDDLAGLVDLVGAGPLCRSRW